MEEDIRNALMHGISDRLSKKSYKFAVAIDKKKMFSQLLFLTFMSFIVACILFISMYFNYDPKALTK